jgi:hypothetical protein
LQDACDVFITHIKPGERDVVMSEIKAQGLQLRIRALHTGQTIPLGRTANID